MYHKVIRILKLHRAYISNRLSYCSRANSCHKLLVRSFGEPTEVVTLESCEVPKITRHDQVLVRVLASPINPADINTIQGVYAIRPDFPFVPGNEAVMEVVDTGSAVKSLEFGDKVIPCFSAVGTWRNFAVLSEKELIKVPKTLDIVMAATIGVNPCTAYRMIKDFVHLKAGDTIVQNCANSAVGQAVIQIASSLQLRTINIVRERSDFDSVSSFLKSLGATVVITDQELRSSSSLKELPKVPLALNGVSGKSATDMMRLIRNGGTLVTYGGMSRQPVTASVGSLIFNDLILRGFWMTRWNERHEKDSERMSMLSDLFALAECGRLTPPPHTLVPLSDFQRGLRDAMPARGKLGRKQILAFE